MDRVGGTVREEQVWRGGALAEVQGTGQDNPVPRWCNKMRMEENHPTRSVRGREETCDGPSVRGSTPMRVSCHGESGKML